MAADELGPLSPGLARTCRVRRPNRESGLPVDLHLVPRDGAEGIRLCRDKDPLIGLREAESDGTLAVGLLRRGLPSLVRVEIEPILTLLVLDG